MIGKLAGAFEAGGVWMWPILGCMAIGLAIVIERFIVLMNASKINKDELLSHVNSYVLKGNIERAAAVANQAASPLAKIVRSGLVAVVNQGGVEEVQTAMDAVALREIPRIEKRIGLLATIANIATLLGLLGTVTGMIQAFGSVANVNPSEKATVLAEAISEAMNATCFGLIVAIPMLAMFGYLSSRAQGLVDDIHEASVATLNFIMSNRDKFKSSRHG